jgi:hypothetical protein
MPCTADQMEVRRGGATECRSRDDLVVTALPDVRVLDFSTCAYFPAPPCGEVGALGASPWANGQLQACCWDLGARPVTGRPQDCLPGSLQLLQQGGNLACAPDDTTLAELFPGIGSLELPAVCPNEGCRVAIGRR